MNLTTEPEISSPPPGETTQQPQTEIFERLRAFSFESDREFATGLAIILGHPETPASEEEIARNDDLVLQAKCYYFARKEKLTSSLNVAAYKSWLEVKPAPDPCIVQESVAELPEIGFSATSLPPSSGGTEQQSTPVGREPSYPTSFAHIVELITTGQPVPGIQQIPDTLLTGQGTPSVKPRRLKPWEKQEAS